jgi:hypothetical protein
VEYIFKNSYTAEPITIVLSEFSLSLVSCQKEKLVPYASILSVRLKKSGKKFHLIIKPSDQPEIVISNTYIISRDKVEDRSPQYTTFVRVLHFHLREKSMAYYICGNSLQRILLTSCASVIVAFGLSYSLANLLPYNSNLIALGLSFLGIALIAIVNWRHFPNVYKPENIPSQFLPVI